MKKNWNVAKVFTLLITVLFLASTLFVGCKNQEPTPEPEPTKYMVTYVTNPEGLQVENFPTMGEVEENKTIELPTLTLEGYTFDGWYDGDTKVESPYKVTKTVTLTAKFTENVAPSLPEDGEEGGTTPPADGEEGGTTPPAGGEEGGTTPPAGDEEGGTTPPAGEGGEGGVIPDPDPVDPVVTFSVTYTVEGIESTLVTDLPKSGDVNKDTVLTLSPLTAPEGYVFDGWFIGDVGVSEYTVVAAVTIVAKFSVSQVDPEPEPDPEPTPTYFIGASWNGWNPAGIFEKFYAKGGDSFKITNGTWDSTYGGVEINALDTEFELVKSDEKNVTFTDDVLTKYEYYNIVLRIDGEKLYVKVVATGDDPYTPPANCGIIYTPEVGKVYVISSDWNSDGAVIAAWLWSNNDDGVWRALTAVEGQEGLLEVVATGYKNVIFRRFGPDQEIGWGDDDWGGKTGDLTLPTDNKVVAIISGWTNDKNVMVDWLPFATE